MVWAVSFAIFAIVAVCVFQVWRVNQEHLATMDRIGPCTMNDLNEAIAFRRSRMVSVEDVQHEINSMGYDFQFIKGFRMDCEETDERAPWYHAQARLNGKKVAFKYILADLNEKNFGKIQKKFLNYGDTCVTIHSNDNNSRMVISIIYLVFIDLCGGAMYGRGHFLGNREAKNYLRHVLNVPNVTKLNGSDNI